MKKKSEILVYGSVSIDILFDLIGNVKNHINLKNGILGTQNFMFTASEKEEYFGGTGGNISYGLGNLGQSPLLFSAAGKDFETYFKKHLENNGVNLRVYEDKKGYTAVFYAMADDERQQIGIFQPGVYIKNVENVPLSSTLSKKEMSDIKIAIFSAGTGKSMTMHMEEFRKQNKTAKIIFDPGQTLMATFNKSQLEKCLKLANVVIGNETEIFQIKSHFGLTFEKIFNFGVTEIIETLGENGSILHTQSGRTKIDVVKAKKVVDTTGAGDAYRAGLIFGLQKGLTMPEAMKIGAKLGSLCVSYQGGQTYSLPKNLLK